MPEAVEADFLKQVWDKKLDATTLHQPLFDEHFSRLRGGAMTGYGRYFSQPRSLDEGALFQRMSQNAARFAAAKQQAIIEECLAHRTDASGIARSRADWERLCKGTLGRHNGQYLRAEVQAATAAGASAEKWQEFERRKHIYPNLRYVTAGDARVREAHAAINGAVYPVDDPFWDKWNPPNGNGCRCDAVQTDKPENRLEPVGEPDKGFANNPGKTGKLFGDDHPYFSRAKSSGRLFEKADLMRERLTRDEVATVISEGVVSKGKLFDLPGMSEKLSILPRDLRNVIAHPHANGPAKNELLYALADALKSAVLVGEAANKNPRKNQTLGWLYLAVDWVGEKFVLNLERIRMEDGSVRVRLYAIKEDNPELPE